MTTPLWRPGTLYNPGTIVRPNNVGAVSSTAPVNGNFESGDTGWDKDTGWTIGTGTGVFSGTYRARGLPPVLNTTIRLTQTDGVPIAPGQSLTVNGKVRVAYGRYDGAIAGIGIAWYDVNDALLSRSFGDYINRREGFVTVTHTAVAPAETAFARIVASVVNYGSTGMGCWLDEITWNYAYQPPQNTLLFRAVQAAAGYSDGTEPTWPTVLGQQIVDNEVTWEAIESSQVTWRAFPLMVSDSYEPDWPIYAGSEVPDNTVVWQAMSRQVTDERLPQSKVAQIIAAKVFTGDDDIVPFSATINPLDWSTRDDAGYLPFGLQSFGSSPVTALGQYRSNLIVFNALGFQMWQVDQDPANMALLDSVPIGCTEPRTVQSFGNDLVFLSSQGVRNISIAGASTNLQAGSFGEPIDSLVQARVKAGTYTPISAVAPQFGQYWLIFGPEAFVLTVNEGKKPSWSRYVFPEAITDTTLAGKDLYLRTSTGKVWLVDEDLTADDVYSGPDTPVLTGEYAGVGINLSWTAATYDDAFEYVIYKSINAAAFNELDRVSDATLAYTDSDVEAGSTYAYTLQSIPLVETWFSSEVSNEVEVPVELTALMALIFFADTDGISDYFYNRYSVRADLSSENVTATIPATGAFIVNNVAFLEGTNKIRAFRITAGSPYTTTVYYSDDRGDSWAQLAALSGVGLITVAQRNGVLLGIGSDNAAQSVARKSVDDGATWASVTTPDAAALFNQAPMVTTDAGFAVIGVRSGPTTRYLYTTADDGATWTQRALPSQPGTSTMVLQGVGSTLVYGYSVDAAGGDARLYVSTDFGANWTPYVNAIDDFYIVYLTYNSAAGHWVAFGYDNTSFAIEVKTTKGATTPSDPSTGWTDVTLPAAIQALDETALWPDAMRYVSGLGTVFVFQGDPAGSAYAYVNSDDTAAGWTEIALPTLGDYSASGALIGGW